jgi:CRP-like cAMP-binding protein
MGKAAGPKGGATRADAAARRAIFAGHELFGGLPAQDIDMLAGQARRASHRKGTVIFARGDEGRSLMAIRSGTVRISTMTADGKEAVLNMLRAGQVFGEIALLDGKPRTADATAATDCELVVLDRAEFVPLLRANPDLALRIIALLCARMRRTSEQIEDVMFLPLEARLAKALLRLAAEQGAGVEAPARLVSVTQRDLGQMIGMSRESTNKQLSAWQREGWVRLTKGGVEILSPEALDSIA